MSIFKNLSLSLITIDFVLGALRTINDKPAVEVLMTDKGRSKFFVHFQILNILITEMIIYNAIKSFKKPINLKKQKRNMINDANIVLVVASLKSYKVTNFFFMALLLGQLGSMVIENRQIGTLLQPSTFETKIICKGHS